MVDLRISIRSPNNTSAFNRAASRQVVYESSASPSWSFQENGKNLPLVVVGAVGSVGNRVAVFQTAVGNRASGSPRRQWAGGGQA